MTSRKDPTAHDHQRVFEPKQDIGPGPMDGASPAPDAALIRDVAAMQLEVALYIESISAQLASMARESDLDDLAYFIDMARIEASIQVERRAGAADETRPAHEPASTKR